MRLSATDVRKIGRRSSGVTNPYLLPEFDEENYEPIAKPLPSTNEITKEAPSVWQKQTGGPMSFKRVAKAITKQKTWSSVLKVKNNFQLN